MGVEEGGDNFESKGFANDDVDKTVTLYACATMWHETRNEMKQMIMSLIR